MSGLEHNQNQAGERRQHEHHYENVGRLASHGTGKPDFHRQCRKPSCDGIAFVQIAWAPDTGWHWLRCCCCGDCWNPGIAR